MFIAMTVNHVHDDKPTESDIAALVRRCVDGDERAFEAVYRATAGAVYGLCLRMTADEHLAVECTQRTYVQAWRNLSRFQGTSKLTTWLHRIAVNEVLGLGRKERTRAQMVSVSADRGAIPTGDASGLIDLERAIALLPEQARRVFLLHGVYGYGHKEIARMLSIAEGTSKAHLHRARELLRNRIGDTDDRH